MKYYPAVVSKEEIDAVIVQPPYRMLMSYHYFKKKPDLVANCVSSGYEVFMDSGAFSAATKGVQIDIDEYCRFIKETGVGVYAGLDVIGDAKLTMHNIEYMERTHGLNPIPTFHCGSDLKDLYAILHYPYIALGGLVFSSNTTRFCDEIWSIILREAKGIRVHGFGLTNTDLMARYPWYSVDSSNYKSGRRFGRIDLVWDDFSIKSLREEQFIEHLKTLGFPVDTLENKKRWFLYDYFSVQSYKQYGFHLAELNKVKDFSYLTNQLKMF